MRRITYWALTTLTVLVLLFSYRTSTESSFAASSDLNQENTTDSTSSNSSTTQSAKASSSDESSSATAEPTEDESTASESSSSTPTEESSSSTPTEESSAESGSSADSGSSAASGTFTGDAVMTRYGNVQVEITVENGQIVKSAVTQVPWNNHEDQQINSRAVPTLNQEAVDAQSADIDMVSGATFTSQGYIQSLQSAIDAAQI